MKYLIINYDGDETFYELADINKIVSDYAQNIFSEADIADNDLKPLEMVTVIYLKNGTACTYRTAKLEMSFD